ncbi:MAG: hypothetical protein AAGF99_00110 [Bacteroidota bacterium]
MAVPSPTAMLRKAYRTVRPRQQKPLPDRLFFLHLPKCGGQSIDAALQQGYRAAGASIAHLDSHASARAAEAAGADLHALRREILHYHMAAKHSRYISGHFMYSAPAWDAFGDAWQYVTVLREPVKRWVSNYFFNKYKGDHHFKIDEPIEEFVESERALAYARSYVTWLTDGISLEEAGSDEAVEQAIANVERFAVVGVLEDLDTFAADCRARFGLPVEIAHRNRNPRAAAEQREELSPEMVARVEALCAPNRRVYDAVRDRIERRGSWLASTPPVSTPPATGPHRDR